MNINKYLIMNLFRLRKSNIPSALDFYFSREYCSLESNRDIQTALLEELLLHSYNHVPYYRSILKDANVVADNKVSLENFTAIPVLTKKHLLDNFEELKSDDISTRDWHLNSTGGSTGVPTKFIQDKISSDYEAASKIYFSALAGKDIGCREMKLVGSERDLIKGSIGSKGHLLNLLFNRTFINSFKMSPDNMENYVSVINKKKPVIIEAYVQSIYELARFIKNNDMYVYSPKSILTSAGTLYPEYKELIEEVFRTKVYNRYGSREAPAIACSCEKDEGLHVDIFNHYLEILNEDYKPCKPGEIGHIYITTLKNYSMPLIRYQIGDMGIVAENESCSCGRGFPLIQNVIGRETEVFRTRDGKVIPGEFFIHFIGVVYNKDFISKFQVIQKDYESVLIKLVLTDPDRFRDYEQELVSSVKMVMGDDCEVNFEFVDDIATSSSGKYLYTVSEIA